ncbi:MAG: histidine kinase, partial [Bryobacteraceae bacterium]
MERWRRQLDVARAALAVGCASIQFMARPDWRSGINIITALFAAYSIAALIWHSVRLPGGHLLGLYSDTLYFFLYAEFGADRSLLLLCALFVYVMLSAIVAHEWWDPFIVAGASIGFLVVAHPPDAVYLWHIVLPAGLLGCFLALIKRRVVRHCDGQTREVEALRAGIKTARETERQRIAGDFHDGPLQGIVGLQMRLEVLRRVFERDPSTGLRELRSIQDLLKEQIVEA